MSHSNCAIRQCFGMFRSIYLQLYYVKILCSCRVLTKKKMFIERRVMEKYWLGGKGMLIFFVKYVDRSAGYGSWWSVAMQFAPGSAGVISSSGVVVKSKNVRSFYLATCKALKVDLQFLLSRTDLFLFWFVFVIHLHFLRFYFEGLYNFVLYNCKSE